MGLFARKNFEPMVSSPLPTPQQPAATVASLSSNEQDLLSTSWSSIASTETTDLMMKMDDEECDSIATLLTADNNEQSVAEEDGDCQKDEQKNGDKEGKKNGDDQRTKKPDSSSSTSTS